MGIIWQLCSRDRKKVLNFGIRQEAIQLKTARLCRSKYRYDTHNRQIPRLRNNLKVLDNTIKTLREEFAPIWTRLPF